MNNLFFYFLFIIQLLFLSSTSWAQNNNQSYAVLVNKLDDGYHLVGTDNILRFKFLEEYFVAASDNNLDFSIYALDREKQTVSVITEKYGENLLSVNVSSLPDNQYFILEVLNKKNEKWYLRFKTQ